MPKMQFFRQTAAIRGRKQTRAEDKRKLKQRENMIEETRGTELSSRSANSVISKAKKLYWSIAVAASTIPFIPACNVDDKVEKTGWMLVGSLLGIMVAAIGIRAIVDKIRSVIKSKKENNKIEKEEPPINWSIEADP